MIEKRRMLATHVDVIGILESIINLGPICRCLSEKCGRDDLTT